MIFLQLELPDFLGLPVHAPVFLPHREDRMRYVLALAQKNVIESGGPFAAAVFELNSGRLVAAGSNRVISCHCSSAHAEIVALSMAQQNLKQFDLGLAPQGPYELVSSAEPCAMCFGAILWSGVQSLVYAARTEDVTAIGFDEGPKHPEWIEALRQRGISVHGDVLREEAKGFLQSYAAAGGKIYNASHKR